jgi:hypothetical protein
VSVSRTTSVLCDGHLGALSDSEYPKLNPKQFRICNFWQAFFRPPPVDPSNAATPQTQRPAPLARNYQFQPDKRQPPIGKVLQSNVQEAPHGLMYLLIARGPWMSREIFFASKPTDIRKSLMAKTIIKKNI